MYFFHLTAALGLRIFQQAFLVVELNYSHIPNFDQGRAFFDSIPTVFTWTPPAGERRPANPSQRCPLTPMRRRCPRPASTPPSPTTCGSSSATGRRTPGPWWRTAPPTSAASARASTTSVGPALTAQGGPGGGGLMVDQQPPQRPPPLLMSTDR